MKLSYALFTTVAILCSTTAVVNAQIRGVPLLEKSPAEENESQKGNIGHSASQARLMSPRKSQQQRGLKNKDRDMVKGRNSDPGDQFLAADISTMRVAGKTGMSMNSVLGGSNSVNGSGGGSGGGSGNSVGASVGGGGAGGMGGAGSGGGSGGGGDCTSERDCGNSGNEGGGDTGGDGDGSSSGSNGGETGNTPTNAPEPPGVTRAPAAPRPAPASGNALPPFTNFNRCPNFYSATFHAQIEEDENTKFCTKSSDCIGFFANGLRQACCLYPQCLCGPFVKLDQCAPDL